jgi:hypothetical protein
MTDNLYRTITALVACGMITKKELKDTTPCELFNLATHKTLQIAMAGSKIQTAYRTAYQNVCEQPLPELGQKYEIETEYDCENKKED